MPLSGIHDDVIKWKIVCVTGTLCGNSPVTTLMFSFICASTNGWVNNRDAGDLRRHRPHHDVTVMELKAQSRPRLTQWWLILRTHVYFTRPRRVNKTNNHIPQSMAKETRNMMTSSTGNVFRVTGTFVRGIPRSPVNSPHKGQWRGSLMFSLIYAWRNDWIETPVIWDAIALIMTSLYWPWNCARKVPDMTRMNALALLHQEVSLSPWQNACHEF